MLVELVKYCFIVIIMIVMIVIINMWSWAAAASEGVQRVFGPCGPLSTAGPADICLLTLEVSRVLDMCRQKPVTESSKLMGEAWLI